MDSFKEQQKGITKIKTSNFSYIWTIHNFTYNDKEFGEPLESPTFYMPDKKDCKWHLALNPKGCKENCKDYVSIYLHLNAAVNPSINTKITFSILDSENKEKYTQVVHYIFKKLVGYGIHNFVKQSVFLDSKNDLLPNDKLTILCKVTAGVEVENFCQEQVNFEEKRIKFTLSSELESILKNKHMSDVMLIADGKEIKAHKTILAARSPVFSAMLETDMQEKQTNRIKFHDTSIDVLQEMLQYLYTGTVNNMKEYVYDLVKLADQYDIKGLKLMCEELFYNELSIKSVIKIFIMADRYNCNVLRPLTLKFLVTHAKDILKTEEFKMFEKDIPILIREMMHAIV